MLHLNKKSGIIIIFVLTIFIVGKGFFSIRSFLKVDRCLDKGLVWDYNRKVCDPDCLTWVEGKGCISLKVLEQIEREVCGEDPYKCTIAQKLEVAKRICKVYPGVINIETTYCDYDFQLKDCGKRKGHYLYPKECGLAPEMTY